MFYFQTPRGQYRYGPDLCYLAQKSDNPSNLVGLLLTYWNRSTEMEKFRELAKIMDQPVRSDIQINTKRAKRLSAAEKAELLAEYESGTLVRDIAEKFDVHRVTVSNLVEAAGMTPRSRGLGPQQVIEAADLYTAGQSLAKLGDRYGVNAETVRQALRRIGVTIRPRPGHGKQPS